MKEQTISINTEVENRVFTDIELPIGKFRNYEDEPFIWIQVLDDGEDSVADRIEKAFNAGEIKKLG